MDSGGVNVGAMGLSGRVALGDLGSPVKGTRAEFESILRTTRGAADPESEARKAAEEFVAQSLVLPILKSIREQNQAAPPFGPGPYEQNIGSLFDMEIASRLVRAQRFDIVDAVARNLLRQSQVSPMESGDQEQGGSDGIATIPTAGDTPDQE